MALRGKKKADPVYRRKPSGKMRTKLVGLFLIVILAFVALAIRITVINAKSGDTYKKKVLTQSQQQYSSRTIPFKRGDILDTNGTVLAASEKVYNLVLDCKVVNSREEYLEPTVAALKQHFAVDEADVRKRLSDATTAASQYQILLKDVTIEQKKNFENYLNPDEETAGLSDEEKLKRRCVKGIWFEENYRRIYPMNSLACDVIGFTYDGTEAEWGIEGYYCSVLNGINGRQYGYVTGNDTAEQTIIPAQDGNTVVSTIDVNIQKMVEEKVDDLWTALSGGPHGSGGAANIGVVVQNPKNGQILSMASSEPYDLNNPRDLTPFYSDMDISLMNDEMMLENLQKLWQNYCISSAFEPGSTFKPVTVAGALEAGVISEDSTYYCDGLQKFGQNDEIHCSIYPAGHGQLDLAGSLMVSCNDAMMQISKKMGASQFLKYQKTYGFGSKTGIDLPGEASGTLFTEDGLGAVELATSSFGQGFTCTMLQEVNAFSSVVNGGYLYQPRIVREIRSSTGAVVQSNEPVLMRQTASTEVSDEVRDYLASVTSPQGSGKYAKVNGYSMGGKTGTAQKLREGPDKYLVSFIGFAPLDDPQVVVYVVVDEPNLADQADSKYPQYLCKQIMTQLLPYLNIFPDEEEAAPPEKVQSFDAMMADLIARKRGSQSVGQASGDMGTQEGTGDAAGAGQGTPEGTGETGGANPGTPEGGTGQGAAMDPQNPEAPYNQDDPEGADNANLPEPPQDKQKITGGDQLDSDGVSNGDLKFIQ